MSSRDSNGVPKYLKLAATLESTIHSGKWSRGKMPSVRGVADEHAVSVVTASRALQVLRDKGLVRTIQRSGCYPVMPVTSEKWALALRLTPGPWLKMTFNLCHLGFQALARRDPMDLETELFPLAAGMTQRDIVPLVRQAKDLGAKGVFLLPSRYSDEEMRADEQLLAACRVEKFPVVLLERNLRGHTRTLEYDLVAADDLDGATKCTQHLIQCGRKRIGIVVASPISSHDDRVAGYLYGIHNAAHTSGAIALPYQPVVLYQSESLPARDSYASLAEQIRKYALDGVLCYEDYTAVGLVMELLSRGIKVPGEVSVVGFNDLPIGNMFPIGITTYSYPSEAIAEQAVRLMRERVSGATQPPIKVTIPGRVIVRESSK